MPWAARPAAIVERSTLRSSTASRRVATIQPTMVSQMSTFHDFEMTSITGDAVSFDQFENQICLIVNVASA
jgi:hypothetical protein